MTLSSQEQTTSLRVFSFLVSFLVWLNICVSLFGFAIVVSFLLPGNLWGQIAIISLLALIEVALVKWIMRRQKKRAQKNRL